MVVVPLVWIDHFEGRSLLSLSVAFLLDLAGRESIAAIVQVRDLVGLSSNRIALSVVGSAQADVLQHRVVVVQLEYTIWADRNRSLAVLEVRP